VHGENHPLQLKVFTCDSLSPFVHDFSLERGELARKALGVNNSSDKAFSTWPPQTFPVLEVWSSFPDRHLGQIALATA